MTWQAIETAPKNKPIIVWTGENKYIALWAENQKIGKTAWIVADLGDGDRLIVQASHWHEAPENPEIKINEINNKRKGKK